MIQLRNKKFLLHTIWLLTFLMPILLVWIGDGLITYLTKVPFRFIEELGPRIMRSVIAALPFLILSLFAKSKFKFNEDKAVISGLLGAAIVVLGSTLFVWGMLFYDTFTLRDGGANIGLSILVMFSPLYISTFMFLGFSITQRYSKRNQ